MKRVYTFGDGKAEGNASMRNLLGGKGANLAEMNLLGMPVPPGFTITTEVCTEYTQYGRDKVVKDLTAEVQAAIAHVEQLTGKKFNDPENPLLVSVRSGARASMPGMMDTVLKRTCRLINLPTTIHSIFMCRKWSSPTIPGATKGA